MAKEKPDCRSCEYRKALAMLADCHVWREDCPLYQTEMCGTHPQREDV